MKQKKSPMSNNLSAKYILLVAISLLATVSLIAQGTIEQMNIEGSSIKYCMAYGKKLYGKNNGGRMYFIVDHGQQMEVDNAASYFDHHLRDGDSSYLVKDKRNIPMSFSSSVAFLNFMYRNNWVLVSNLSPSNYSVDTERIGQNRQAGKIQADDLSTFLFKRAD